MSSTLPSDKDTVMYHSGYRFKVAQKNKPAIYYKSAKDIVTPKCAPSTQVFLLEKKNGIVTAQS